MRIWLINHYAIPPTSAGGTRHYNFAKQLQKRGHEVVIIAANYNHLSHRYMGSLKDEAELDTRFEVPFVWLPVPAYKGNTLARFWNMLAFMNSILRNKILPQLPVPDLVLGSSPHLFAALGAARLARRMKKPFILEIRDLWPESLVDLGRFTAKHPLIIVMKWIERYLYKHAQGVISLLPCADQYLIQEGVKPESILWLPNSVDLSAIPGDALIPPTNAKFTIMNAGAHGVANDLDTVLSAAKILENQGLSDRIRICLVGDGPEKARLKQRAVNENIHMVEFMDAVPKNQVYDLLKQADAFLMLLKNSPVFRWGISPNKLFDYLAMERPIIFAVDTPFNPIEKAKAGLTIKPSEPEALASAIYNLALTPKTELQEMAKRGKRYVMEHHDLFGLSLSLERLMQEVHDRNFCFSPSSMQDVGEGR